MQSVAKISQSSSSGVLKAAADVPLDTIARVIEQRG